MTKNFLSKKYKNLHFVGVGGVSMSGLAEYALSLGLNVSGSDVSCNLATDRLQEKGARIFLKHHAQNVKGAQALVYTSALSDDNCELNFARKHNIPIIKRSEFLGTAISEYKHSVAVAGCHGKTTATAMIAHVLMEGKKDPTVFLGGEDKAFNNFRLGSSDYAVAEACEYKKNLLDIKAKISVVLNVDVDHMDSYANKSDLIDTFKKFSSGFNILNADDESLRELSNNSTVTFGIDNLANYQAVNLKLGKAGYSFTLKAYGINCGRITLKVAGRHNVYNALAAAVVGDVLGVSCSDVKKALENFESVGRRNEYLGEKDGVNYYADYAHHPKEIEATLLAFREQYKGQGEKEDFITVFQPHTYSRTKYLLNEFVKALIGVNNLIIYQTYPAREEYDETGSAETLYYKLLEEGKVDCVYAENTTELTYYVKVMGKDKVVALGAGDIYGIIKSIITRK